MHGRVSPPHQPPAALKRGGLLFRAVGRVLRYAPFFLYLGSLGLQAQPERMLSNYDRDCLAAVIVLEAGGEGAMAMQAVLNVIARRANDIPSRATAVVLRPNQFAVLRDIHGQSDPDWTPVLHRAERRFTRQLPVARALVSLWENRQLGDITDGCDYFLTVGARRIWTRDLTPGPTIGRLQFFRELKQQ